MVFAPHQRLTMIGTVGPSGAPVEIFSMGINLTGTAGAFTPAQQTLDDLTADCVAFFGSNGTRIGPWAQLRAVKLASIGPDGKYTADALMNEVVPFKPGNAIGPVYPPQVALCVSLLTGRRGATGRGRFYLPAPVSEVDTQGLITAAEANTIATSCRDFLNALGNQPGVDPGNLRPCVSSSKGYNTPVTGVRVGRVLDTIRSRRNALNESYTDPLVVS